MKGETLIYTQPNADPHLESFWHVCRADLIVLIGHVAALQLTGLIDLKDATTTSSSLGLLLRSIP